MGIKMICPECKNILRNDLNFPTIWKCNNKKCKIDSIVVNYKKIKRVKKEDRIVATFDTADLAKQFLLDNQEKRKMLRKQGFPLKKAKKPKFIKLTKFGFKL